MQGTPKKQSGLLTVDIDLPPSPPLCTFQPLSTLTEFVHGIAVFASLSLCANAIVHRPSIPCSPLSAGMREDLGFPTSSTKPSPLIGEIGLPSFLGPHNA